MPVDPDLSSFDNKGFDRGAGILKESLWRLASAFIFQSQWMHHYRFKAALLRAFGAKIGRRVRIKPGVKITFPWKLAVGDDSWIGEGAWIDNLDHVHLGSNVCISQGAYLCTGNHDYTKASFDLITAPIFIEDGAWISARSTVAPGTVVRKSAVLSMGSLGKGVLEAYGIYSGLPAQKIGIRG